jgi:hypothetical protein
VGGGEGERKAVRGGKRGRGERGFSSERAARVGGRGGELKRLCARVGWVWAGGGEEGVDAARVVGSGLCCFLGQCTLDALTFRILLDSVGL